MAQPKTNNGISNAQIRMSSYTIPTWYKRVVPRYCGEGNAFHSYENNGQSPFSFPTLILSLSRHLRGSSHILLPVSGFTLTVSCVGCSRGVREAQISALSHTHLALETPPSPAQPPAAPDQAQCGTGMMASAIPVLLAS